jgi:hypothetical protein
MFSTSDMRDDLDAGARTLAKGKARAAVRTALPVPEPRSTKVSPSLGSTTSRMEMKLTTCLRRTFVSNAHLYG